MKRVLFFFTLLNLVSFVSFGNDDDTDRSLDKEKLNNYRSKRAFDYSGEAYNSSTEIEKEFLRPDGTRVKRMKDGSVLEEYPDDRKVLKRKDGVTVYTEPDGTTTYERSDGGKLSDDPAITDDNGDNSIEDNRKFTDGSVDRNTFSDKEKEELTPIEPKVEHNSPSFSIPMPLVYAFIIIIIVVIILIIIKNTRNRPLVENENYATDGEVIENIHDIDFESTLDRFIRLKQYRDATRYLFLEVLKELDDKKHIHWDQSKTNREYTYEIKSAALLTSFRKVTLIYDHIWYGKKEISEDQFSIIKKEFDSLKQLLTR